VFDQVELLLGVAGAGRNHHAADRARARVEDEAAGRQVIGKRVEHQVAGAQAGSKERAARAPGIVVPAFRLVDRPGRGEQAAERGQRRRHAGHEAAERRRGLLQSDQVGLAQHRQAGQRRARGDRCWIDRAQVLPPAGGGERGLDQAGQPLQEVGLAGCGVARFACVEVVGHGGSGPSAAIPVRAAACE
jgi:hypothetical protein